MFSTSLKVRFIHFIKTKMELRNVVNVLHKLAPRELAESWDNVGLLVEPTQPHQVDKLLLTNDLTEDVVSEAIQKQVQMVLSYHPPIFKPLLSLTCASWKERVILKCVENKIAVFSPHTSFDCIMGGVNDWLLEAFDFLDISPIKQHFSSLNQDSYTHCIDVVTTENVTTIDSLRNLNNVQVKALRCDGDSLLLKVYCNTESLAKVTKFLTENVQVPYTTTVLKHEQLPVLGHGMGRKGKLNVPITLKESIQLIKSHLKIPHLRIAVPSNRNYDSSISTIAACAGSGASILRNVCADLLLTGEMSHHEVLDAVHKGRIVVLCEHSNTERGFLKKLAGQLKDFLPNVEILISDVDKDPLTIV